MNKPEEKVQVQLANNAAQIYELRRDVDGLKEMNITHQSVMSDVRDDIKGFMSAIVDIQLDLRTMQERQSRMDTFTKAFMGVFLSVITALIIYGLKALI